MSPQLQTNPQLTQSIVQQPLLTVILNGSVTLPAFTAEVTNNAHFSSDTFSLSCALTDMPPNYGKQYWASSSQDQVEVFMGYRTGQKQSFIVGNIDNVEWDVILKTLRFVGRDLSAQFIDTKTVDISMNQTSSDVAAALAANHGMQTSITKTTTKIGTYFQNNGVNVDQGQFTHLSREQSEWDLLIFLAQQEGFDVWVSGNTLFFQAPIDLSKATPYILNYSEATPGQRYANFEGLRFSRAETLARDVIVNVRSWNQQAESSFTVSYRRNQAQKSQRSGGQAQVYSFTVPNLTKLQAQAYAMNKAEEITRNERIMDAKLDGDLILNNRMPILITGTETDYDQLYYPDSITRVMSYTNFDMTVRAKNHSTQSTVVL